MHECPYCGEVCDCDGEDIWWDDVDECSHDCDEPSEEDFLRYGEDDEVNDGS